MYKLGYGLVFLFATSFCFGQNSVDTTGINYEIRVGISGQFPIIKKEVNTPYLSQGYSTTRTSFGLGLPITARVNFNKFALAVVPVFRYPITKEWMVSRVGFIEEDDRSFVLDLHLGLVFKFKASRSFLSKSSYGLGMTLLNLVGKVTGNYDILTSTGWTAVHYNNMRMISFDLSFNYNLSKRITINSSLMFIEGSQIPNRPDIGFSFMGRLSLNYCLLNRD